MGPWNIPRAFLFYLGRIIKRIRNLFRVRFFCVLRHCGDMSVKGGRKWGGGESDLWSTQPHDRVCPFTHSFGKI